MTSATDDVEAIRFPRRMADLDGYEQMSVEEGRGFEFGVEVVDDRDGIVMMYWLASDRDNGGRALLRAARGIPAFERLIAEPQATVEVGVDDLAKLDTSVRNEVNGHPVPSRVWAGVRGRMTDALADTSAPLKVRLEWKLTLHKLDLPREERHAPLP